MYILMYIHTLILSFPMKKAEVAEVFPENISRKTESDMVMVQSALST